MEQSRAKKLIAVIVIVFVLLYLVFALFVIHKHKNEATKHPSPDPAIAVLTAYVQAHENSVGADQPNAYAWLNQVKSLTTAQWFKQLQPVEDPQAGGVSNDYRIAHQYNYVIKATVKDCNWTVDTNETTATHGVLVCSLTDRVVDRNTGQIVADNDLPFGWTHNGKQLAPMFDMVKQSGKWLVNEDATGKAL